MQKLSPKSTNSKRVVLGPLIYLITYFSGVCTVVWIQQKKSFFKAFSTFFIAERDDKVWSKPETSPVCQETSCEIFVKTNRQDGSDCEINLAIEAVEVHDKRKSIWFHDESKKSFNQLKNSHFPADCVTSKFQNLGVPAWFASQLSWIFFLQTNFGWDKMSSQNPGRCRVKAKKQISPRQQETNTKRESPSARPWVSRLRNMKLRITPLELSWRMNKKSRHERKGRKTSENTGKGRKFASSGWKTE